MRKEKKVAGIGMGAVVALLLVGCGGGGDERPAAYTPTDPVSAEATSTAETLPGAEASTG